VPNEGDFALDDTRIHDIPQVTTKKNDTLTPPFSEEEMRVVVFQMEHDKAPGLDGHPTKFIRISGMSPRLTYWSCSIVFMPTNLTYLDLNLVRYFIAKN
jgi:hypothetical protein